jgi:hypothetical protein
MRCRLIASIRTDRCDYTYTLTAFTRGQGRERLAAESVEYLDGPL